MGISKGEKGGSSLCKERGQLTSFGELSELSPSLSEDMLQYIIHLFHEVEGDTLFNMFRDLVQVFLVFFGCKYLPGRRRIPSP